MAKRFGSVYSIYIGSRPAVILNGFEAMKEALLTKSTDFAGRPQDMMVNRITRGKGLSDLGLLVSFSLIGTGVNCMARSAAS